MLCRPARHMAETQIAWLVVCLWLVLAMVVS